MILAFTLTMPGVGSWDGRWTGADRLHAVVRNVGKSQKAAVKIAPLLGKCFAYSWSDGWRASVSVRAVDGKEAARLRRRSSGFCGYEWMIDSLLANGRIEVPS